MALPHFRQESAQINQHFVVDQDHDGNDQCVDERCVEEIDMMFYCQDRCSPLPWMEDAPR
jgi:hypothetical protein